MRPHPSLLLILLLAGCGGGSGLTIHNGTPSTLRIEGLPSGGELLVDPGTLARVDGFARSAALVAIPTTGEQETHTAEVAAPPPGGEAIWSIGGAACFVEGDFTSYYEAPPEVPARAEFVSMVSLGQTTWVSEGQIAAAPGQRLPGKQRGGAVRAVVQVPCDATVSPEIARAWIEMILPDIEPL
jgi:hypothetical protein